MRRSGLRVSVLVSSLALTSVAAMGPWGVAVADASGTGTVSGSVWNDADRNGVYSSGEVPFANIPLDVYAGNTYVTGGYTDAYGNYSITGLTDGTYIVEVDAQTWNSMRDAWVPTTTGGLRYQLTVNLAGSAVANFGLRQVVRSTTMGAPMSSYTGANGLVANSYDDAVTAKALYDDLASVQLMGPEAGTTTLNFDSPSSSSDTISSVSGGPPYSNFHATMYVSFDSWVTSGDNVLVHEYGHSWSKYNADITQQDPSFASYLQARGLAGNPNLGTSWMWEPAELIAEDYRQLFGTPSAASYPQANTAIPPAASVSGLKSFLQNTYDVSASAPTPPAPYVASIAPAVAPSSGGMTVTATGGNFSGSGWSTQSVQVGGVTAAFTLLSPTQISVVLPPGVGTQDVIVTTNASSGSSTSAASPADVVTYVPAPTVTSLSVTSGPLRGGTTVTVSGTSFAGPGFSASSVAFGGSAGSKLTVLSPTQLTVVSPSMSATGSVNVVVTTAGGSSALSSADVFTYRKK